MTPAQTKEQIEKALKKGFRYAYVSKEKHTLSTALTFKQWSTSEEGAFKRADNELIADKKIKVWDLQKELVRLERNN